MMILCCALWLGSDAQSQPQYNRFDTTAENEKYWNAWLKDLYEMGIVKEKDSIKFNDETRQIMLDSNFRKLIYPPSYSWQAAINLLKAMELKKAFWYLINLYSADTANKKYVMATLIPYDKFMDMEKVMVSTFYTYGLLDPRTCSISNGKLVITRPDIVEKQFALVKEIISYIDYYRKQQKQD